MSTEQDAAEATARRRGRVGWAYLIVAALLFTLMGVVYFTGQVSLAQGETTRETETQELRTTWALAQDEQAAAEKQAHDELMGVKRDRLEEDREVIGELLKTSLTWSNGKEYENARASTVRKYALEEGSSFMSSFLPKAPINVDSSGDEYYWIDSMDLNSRVGSFKPLVLDVRGTLYDYVVFVAVQTSSRDGNALVAGTSVMLVTVDGTGGPSSISELSAHVSTAKDRTSG